MVTNYMAYMRISHRSIVNVKKILRLSYDVSGEDIPKGNGNVSEAQIDLIIMFQVPLELLCQVW